MLESCMRALIQRVCSAQVVIDTKVIGKIDTGLLVLLGVMQGDTADQATQLLDKITTLRIFNDDTGKMNHSLLDVDGSLLVVSQFTLAADCRKGRRPNFTQAAAPELGKELYECFINRAHANGIPTESGKFAANMQVKLTNDGPVTIWLDTEDLKRQTSPHPDKRSDVHET